MVHYGVMLTLTRQWLRVVPPGKLTTLWCQDLEVGTKDPRAAARRAP